MVVEEHLVIEFDAFDARLRDARYLPDRRLVERLFQIGAAETVAEAACAPVTGGKVDAISIEKGVDQIAFQIVRIIGIQFGQIVGSDAHGDKTSLQADESVCIGDGSIFVMAQQGSCPLTYSPRRFVSTKEISSAWASLV